MYLYRATGVRSGHGPVPVVAAPAAGICRHRSQSAGASTCFFVVPKLRAPASRRAGSLSAARRAARRPAGSATRTPHHQDAGSTRPEPGTRRRGAPDLAAVPERIQGRHIGRGGRVSGRATLAPAGMTPPGGRRGRRRERSRGGRRRSGGGSGWGGHRGGGRGGRRRRGRVVADDVAGVVAAVIAAGDGAGPVEVAAVVAGAGDEGANDPLLNGAGARSWPR